MEGDLTTPTSGSLTRRREPLILQRQFLRLRQLKHTTTTSTPHPVALNQLSLALVSDLALELNIDPSLNMLVQHNTRPVSVAKNDIRGVSGEPGPEDVPAVKESEVDRQRQIVLPVLREGALPVLRDDLELDVDAHIPISVGLSGLDQAIPVDMRSRLDDRLSAAEEAELEVRVDRGVHSPVQREPDETVVPGSSNLT